MAAYQPTFSPKQVAKALNASESSVKRWCDQGAIETIRTVGGHRKISLDAIRKFIAATNRTLSDPTSIGLKLTPESRVSDLPGGSEADQIDFRNALAAGDETLCRRILRSRIERTGERNSRVADYLITDAMHGIGHAWDESKIDAYQERRGCEICLRLIHELRATLPLPSPNAPIALGGTLTGDPYQIPTALVELTLRESGWNATSLGCELPVDSFIKAAQDHRPALIWLSVSAVRDEATFFADENRLVDQLPAEIAIVLGGRGIPDRGEELLQYSAICGALSELSDFAHLLTASKSA